MLIPFRINFWIVIGLNLLGWFLYHTTGTGFVVLPGFIWTVGSLVAWIHNTVQRHEHWEIPTFFSALVVTLLAGAAVYVFHKGDPLNSFKLTWQWLALGTGGILAVFGLMEFVFLRLLANFRLGALVRVTYYEVLLQPFTVVVLLVALGVIILSAFTPFYTFNEDTKMYRDVASQFVVIAALAVVVFAAAKVIDEEIENRTMLTLMAKPIARWQVVVGKYLGIAAVGFVLIVALGMASSVAAYLRFYDDQRVDFNMSGPDSAERARLMWDIYKPLLAMAPMFLLQFLQVATLAAIAVAISTRFALAFNMTAIAVLYVVANLVQYLPGLLADAPPVWRGLATYASYLLPTLSHFDLSPRLIYGNYAFASERSDLPGLPFYAQFWKYLALAATYAVAYITGALALATALFRTRELT